MINNEGRESEWVLGDEWRCSIPSITPHITNIFIEKISLTECFVCSSVDKIDIGVEFDQ